jgi:predicted acylesterase/phospholipase RssA
MQALRVVAFLCAMACVLALASCASQPRVPYTKRDQVKATVPGIPGARIWADDPGIGRVPPPPSRVRISQPVLLALSGGGADGAFGAGLLTGWTANGTRPQFTFVTGASAGALMAPFAFLGPSQDQTLINFFATGEMANLLQPESLPILLSVGFFKAEPLRELIARHVDAELLEAIAREHRIGRRLYVVTTNLDAQRTAIWDMGQIAASGEPHALELFRNVLAASASIPGIFAPVLIDVEADGRRFAEMHVDAAVITNVLVVPESVLVSGTALFPPDARPKVYIILNRKLAPEFEVVEASTIPVVRRSIETATRANTRTTLLASYQFARTRNWEFHLASVDADYPSSPTFGFDPEYMQGLFEHGYQRGKRGELWLSTPGKMKPLPRVATGE